MSPRASPVRAWALASAVSATVDILYNIVFWDLLMHRLTVLRLFQYIASGALGRAAYQGGWGVGMLGLAFHTLVATTWSGVFVLAYTRLAWVRARPGLAVVLHGVLVWAVMTWIVVPLSAAQRGPFVLWSAVLNFVTHIVFVALPMVLVTRAVLGRSGGATSAGNGD